jgi:predicted  nucleic acid-binding Zn-ribbon protein
MSDDPHALATPSARPEPGAAGAKGDAPPMREAFQRLAELQACDDELWAREQEHAALPGRRAALAEQRGAVEQAAVQAKQALVDAEAAQRRVEGELQDQEVLLRRLESQQFQVKSNDAYTALLHEIERAQRAISDCETRLLEGMDAIESARAVGAQAEAEGRGAVARIGGEQQALDAREKALDAELANVRAARGRIVAASDPKLIEQYEKIASRRRPAVVRIRGALCLGCRVDVPPQRCIELMRGERVITCGNCHRILLPAQ